MSAEHRRNPDMPIIHDHFRGFARHKPITMVRRAGSSFILERDFPRALWMFDHAQDAAD